MVLAEKSSTIEQQALADAIGGFALLAGRLVSVLDEPRLKALCLLEMREGGASFSEIEDSMGRGSGAVDNALERMRDAGIIDKVGLQPNPIYRLTGLGHAAFAFCLSLVTALRNTKQAPPYMNQDQFERAKKLAGIFEEQLRKLKFREQRIARMRM